MRFYTLESQSERGATWGKDIHPDPRAALSSHCARCGSSTPFPHGYPDLPLTMDVEGGSRYPDLLGNQWMLLVLSKRVLDVFEAERVGRYKAYPLTIGRATGRIKTAQAPTYAHVRVDGRCELNLEAMGVRFGEPCPHCGARRKEPAWDHNIVIRPETWDGSDLFRNELFPTLLFCTERVFELARQHQWTNFQFSIPEDAWGPDQIPRVVEYREARKR